MTVDKIPGENCYIILNSAEYRGPNTSFWVCGMISQGTGFPQSGLVYMSLPEKIALPATVDWTLYRMELRIVLVPVGGITPSPGLADAHVVIMATDLLGMSAVRRFAITGEAVYVQTWRGAYNFIFPGA
jgi:hypothetical protein